MAGKKRHMRILIIGSHLDATDPLDQRVPAWPDRRAKSCDTAVRMGVLFNCFSFSFHFGCLKRLQKQQTNAEMESGSHKLPVAPPMLMGIHAAIQFSCVAPTAGTSELGSVHQMMSGERLHLVIFLHFWGFFLLEEPAKLSGHWTFFGKKEHAD